MKCNPKMEFLHVPTKLSTDVSNDVLLLAEKGQQMIGWMEEAETKIRNSTGNQELKVSI